MTYEDQIEWSGPQRGPGVGFPFIPQANGPIDTGRAKPSFLPAHHDSLLVMFANCECGAKAHYQNMPTRHGPGGKVQVHFECHRALTADTVEPYGRVVATKEFVECPHQDSWPKPTKEVKVNVVNVASAADVASAVENHDSDQALIDALERIKNRGHDLLGRSWLERFNERPMKTSIGRWLDRLAQKWI